MYVQAILTQRVLPINSQINVVSCMLHATCTCILAIHNIPIFGWDRASESNDLVLVIRNYISIKKLKYAYTCSSNSLDEVTFSHRDIRKIDLHVQGG